VSQGSRGEKPRAGVRVSGAGAAASDAAVLGLVAGGSGSGGRAFSYSHPHVCSRHSYTVVWATLHALPRAMHSWLTDVPSLPQCVTPAHMFMYCPTGITEDVASWRTDVVSRLVDALGHERLMFEAADPNVFSWCGVKKGLWFYGCRPTRLR